jgi:hypothetical protein
MMATTPIIRRSWLRPRFSLRVLLLAFTAFAIGFPIWYRWPYEESEAIGMGIRRTRTWQRQWSGGRLQHGPEMEFHKGELIKLKTYRNGIMHGPYFDSVGLSKEGQESVITWEMLTKGEYVDGEKDGKWIEMTYQGPIEVTFNHGVCAQPRPWLMPGPSP